MRQGITWLLVLMVAGLIFFLSPRGHPAPTSRPLPNFVAINLGGGRQALPSVPHLRVRNVGTRGLADARVVLIPNTVFWRLSSGIVQRLRKAVRGGTVVVAWQDTRQTVDGGLVERALQVPGAPSVTDARLDAFASSNVYAGGGQACERYLVLDDLVRQRPAVQPVAPGTGPRRPLPRSL